jgi:hypothetical protein
MWIMTNFGAFSTTLRDPKIVDVGDDRLLQVRARSAKHLRALKNKYMPNASKIVRLTFCDYEFRIYCTHAEWAAAVAHMVHDINYRNFKDTVVDDDLHDAYLRVWSVLYDALATNRKYPSRKRGKKGKNKSAQVSQRDRLLNAWLDEYEISGPHWWDEGPTVEEELMMLERAKR